MSWVEITVLALLSLSILVWLVWGRCRRRRGSEPGYRPIGFVSFEATPAPPKHHIVIKDPTGTGD